VIAAALKYEAILALISRELLIVMNLFTMIMPISCVTSALSQIYWMPAIAGRSAWHAAATDVARQKIIAMHARILLKVIEVPC
jgi:hypothetical protein